jgi:hypothetical protein
MFGYLRFRWKLGQLERERRQLEKKYEAELKAAKKRKASADEIHFIENDGAGDYFHFQDEIKKLHSRYLSSQASRLVPTGNLNRLASSRESGDVRSR